MKKKSWGNNGGRREGTRQEGKANVRGRGEGGGAEGTEGKKERIEEMFVEKGRFICKSEHKFSEASPTM